MQLESTSNDLSSCFINYRLSGQTKGNNVSMCQKRNIKCHQSAEDRKRTTLLPDLQMFASSAAHKDTQNCYYLWNTPCLHLLVIQNQVQIGGDHYMTKSTQTLQLDHRLKFTARKRSLGQGNVFKPVCHSVHRDRGWLPGIHHRSHDQGGLPPKGVCIEGGLYPGGLPPGGLGRTPPAMGYYGIWSTSARGTYPTGMHSCFPVCNHRYSQELTLFTIFSLPASKISQHIRYSDKRSKSIFSKDRSCN